MSDPVSSPAMPDDVLPLVGEDQGNRGLWLGLGGIALGGILLFMALEANRASNAEPPVAPAQDYARAAAPRPELIIPTPPEPPAPILPQAFPPAPPAAPPAQAPVRLARVEPSTPSQAQPSAPFQPGFIQPSQPALPQTPDPGRAAPVIVYDVAPAPAAATAPAGASSNGGAANAITTRAMAAPIGDTTYVVPQGSLLHAVLETAIDSTQPGQVRAMISSDVRNAAGTLTLIPKGSRIFGELRGELNAGQKRAQIIWNRLVRPDGVAIALESPAADPLGRAGIKGRVNTHFGTRLLGALLQSSIDFGAIAASRAITDGNGVIIALPNAIQASTSQLIQPPPRPTLKVRHGTRISVFVARDLDFGGVQ